MEHPGFVWLLETAQAQMEARKAEVFAKPLKSLHEVPEQEYLKGEIAGIGLFTKLAQAQLELLTEQIDDLIEEAAKQKENADERDEEQVAGSEP